jgi:tetratricopeptide (TPR) repeat protein
MFVEPSRPDVLEGKIAAAIEHFRAGRLTQAAELYAELGDIAQTLGDLSVAASCFLQALEFQPGMGFLHNRLGNIMQRQKRFAAAEGSYRQALALTEETPEILGNLASALQGQGKLREAIACYRRVVALQPDFAPAHYNTGCALLEQGEFAQAEASLRQAIAFGPGHANAHNNLGNALRGQQRFEEALLAYRRALELDPENTTIQHNLGCMLRDLGKFEPALENFRNALRLRPGDPQLLFSAATLQVQRGDFSEGWGNYEQRWLSRDHDTPNRGYPQPLWNGERLSSGKVLLWGEQGLGDEIMFAGLVPDAIATGNRFILSCDARLKPLFARSFPEVEVVSGIALEVLPEFAAHLPTGSLPRLFRNSWQDFARTRSPYLMADAAERGRLRRRYGAGRRAGLAWFTRGKRTGKMRSLPLAAFASLFRVPEIQWISLQYGGFDALEEEVRQQGAPIQVDRSIDPLLDADGYAAQIAALDLVLTIDSATAHFAGALGIPAWVLLPCASDWRWFLQSTRSPWYPSMRLFRQQQPDDWTSVLELVQHELATLSR